GQFSAWSHSPAAPRHSTLAPAKPSTGQLVEVPVHVSATSHGPAVGRQVAPAFPAGCWQASLDPSHPPSVHGLVSAVHAVPAPFLSSPAQCGPVLGQFSAWSHSPAAGRHSRLVEAKASSGQLVLVPVHVSATSHGPAAARQV